MPRWKRILRLLTGHRVGHLRRAPVAVLGDEGETRPEPASFGAGARVAIRLTRPENSAELRSRLQSPLAENKRQRNERRAATQTDGSPISLIRARCG